MKKKIAFLSILCWPAFLYAADEARLLRFPSTNGSEIVFSYAGIFTKFR